MQRARCSETMEIVRLAALGAAVVAGLLFSVASGSGTRASAQRAAAAAAPADHYATRCSQPRIVSRLGQGWRSRSLSANGVAFLGLRTDWAERPAGDFAPSGSDDGRAKYWPIRVPIRIAGPGPVRVAIAPSARSRAAFAYAPRLLWGRHAKDGVLVEDGHAVVTLRRCNGEATVFEGGIVVVEPMCLPIHIFRPGGQKNRRMAPIGQAC